MATVTSFYGTIQRPELGTGRLVIQYGKAKWHGKRKRCTLATDINYVRSFGYTWATPGGSVVCTAAASGMVRTTGTIAGGAMYLTRATLGGAPSGAAFWYKIVGEP